MHARASLDAHTRRSTPREPVPRVQRRFPGRCARAALSGDVAASHAALEALWSICRAEHLVALARRSSRARRADPLTPPLEQPRRCPPPKTPHVLLPPSIPCCSAREQQTHPAPRATPRPARSAHVPESGDHLRLALKHLKPAPYTVMRRAHFLPSPPLPSRLTLCASRATGRPSYMRAMVPYLRTYGGPALASDTLRPVRRRDERRRPHHRSTFDTRLLAADAWVAERVDREAHDRRLRGAAPHLLRTFTSAVWAPESGLTPANAPPGDMLASARVVVTADDRFTLYVNRALNTLDAWKTAQIVHAVDFSASGHFVTFTDGSSALISPGTAWKAIAPVARGLLAPENASCGSAVSLSAHGAAPGNTPIAGLHESSSAGAVLRSRMVWRRLELPSSHRYALYQGCALRTSASQTRQQVDPLCCPAAARADSERPPASHATPRPARSAHLPESGGRAAAPQTRARNTPKCACPAGWAAHIGLAT
ncbi:hypothetical protein B0H15DRAFT_952390 [Mycena belliarum]|uniref:Uncharacterized protein n=1 Tax=Mycena belliarum TaxID=1033014 RepID=A0AAD6U2R0_9AGAR|nr:hypothetical protein B0H15DRAFT_952390 [Mycena belliae]